MEFFDDPSSSEYLWSWSNTPEMERKKETEIDRYEENGIDI